MESGDDAKKKRKREEGVEPAEKLLRSSEQQHHRADRDNIDSSAWTLKLPRPLVTLLRDLCQRLPSEHFVTVRSSVSGRAIHLNTQWTIETSNEAQGVLPRWMNAPELIMPETDGELIITMHTHPKAAITQSLNSVPNLRRRQQHARTKPLLYVPSTADVNNMLRYGMHVHIVVTPFHWFICHVSRPSEPTQLTWDMPTLLSECESGDKTALDWVHLMNARCDNFAVVLLQADSLNFDYDSCESALPWVHYDTEHAVIELDFAAAKRAEIEPAEKPVLLSLGDAEQAAQDHHALPGVVAPTKASGGRGVEASVTSVSATQPTPSTKCELDEPPTLPAWWSAEMGVLSSFGGRTTLHDPPLPAHFDEDLASPNRKRKAKVDVHDLEARERATKR